MLTIKEATKKLNNDNDKDILELLQSLQTKREDNTEASLKLAVYNALDTIDKERLQEIVPFCLNLSYWISYGVTNIQVDLVREQEKIGKTSV